MATITIRNLDDELKRRLRIQAAEHGRSMEEEARNMLRQALPAEQKPATGFATAFSALFRKHGGVDLTFPVRPTLCMQHAALGNLKI